MSGLLPLPQSRKKNVVNVKSTTSERATMNINDDAFEAESIRPESAAGQFRPTSTKVGNTSQVAVLDIFDRTKGSQNSKESNRKKSSMPGLDVESSRIKLVQKLRNDLEIQKNDIIFNKTVTLADQKQKKVGQLFCEVLQQPKNQRSKIVCDVLQKHMKEHPFFKTRNMRDQQILDVLNCMDYSEMPEDREVFESGSIGDLYFMIVEGVVEIQIVNKNESQLYAQTVSELLQKKVEFQDINILLKIIKIQLTQAQKILQNQLEANAENKGGYEVNTSVMQKDVVHAQKWLEETLVRSNLVSQEIQQKKRFKDEELMIPVLHLGSGMDFGDLALKIDPIFPTKIVPRAATVKCMTHCKFATMSKTDYQGILFKIDQKNNEKLVNFFKNVPFMKPMTKTQIQKSIVGFQKRNCIRGQVVCKEDTPATHVYIVYEGEFELTKAAKLDVLTFFAKADDHVSENLILKRKSGEKPKGPQNLKFATKSNVGLNNQMRFGLICSGQVCGDDDIVANRNYKATLTCTANHSSLYIIPKTDFLRIFKSNEQVWKNLQKIKKTKAEQNAKCMNNYFSISLEGCKVGKTETDMKSNILLNQHEADYRFTLSDIVKDYPFIKKNTHLPLSNSTATQKANLTNIIQSKTNLKMGLKNQYSSSKYENVYEQFIVEGLGDRKSALRNKFGLVKAQSTILKPLALEYDSIEQRSISGNFAGRRQESQLKSACKDQKKSRRSVLYQDQADNNRLQLSKMFGQGSGKDSQTSLNQYGAKDKIVKVAYSLKASNIHHTGANSTHNTGFQL